LQKLVKGCYSYARALIAGILGFDSAQTPSNWTVTSADIQATPRPNPTAKSSLSDSQRHLVELMQWLNFGRIEGLRVRNGEPVFDPGPRVVRKLKIGGENGPRPELFSDEFPLKAQTIELFAAISELGEGTVLSIDVKHGLPFAVELELTTVTTTDRAGA
jgi:hypothetical protein